MAEQPKTRYIQARLTEDRYKALSLMGTLSGMNQQETLIAAIDLLLAKPDAKKVRELAGMPDETERISYFLANASPNFKAAVMRIIDAWYETHAANSNARHKGGR